MDESPRSTGVLEATADVISPDDVFAVLTARQRHRLLVALEAAETPERLSSLARSLAAKTNATDHESVARIRTRLYHCHVPKLAELGIVDYDADEGTVDLTAAGRTVADALDR